MSARRREYQVKRDIWRMEAGMKMVVDTEEEAVHPFRTM